jgi:large subunit ribosomal protein L25
MKPLELVVESRTAVGKGSARRARALGKLPGVFYGPGSPAQPIEMDRNGFERHVRNLEGTHLIELKSQDSALQGRMVLVRDLQEDPVGGYALHVDLVEVPLDKAIEVSVPLHFVGKAEGVGMGGVLQPLLRELLVSCLPTAIPQSIEVDVTPVGLGQSLHVNEITLPEGATPARDDNAAVVAVNAPSTSAAADGGGDAAAASTEGAEAPAAGDGEAAPES